MSFKGITARPGVHTSEFAVSALTVVWYLVNAWQDYVTTTGAATLSAPAIAYIISRGLAKYEQRNTVAPPPPPAPPTA